MKKSKKNIKGKIKTEAEKEKFINDVYKEFDSLNKDLKKAKIEHCIFLSAQGSDKVKFIFSGNTVFLKAVRQGLDRAMEKLSSQK